MTIYVNTRGEIVDNMVPHLAEQFVNGELSVIYYKTPEDRALLEEAAVRFGAKEVAEIARVVVNGCDRVGRECNEVGCAGKCSPVGGPHFATCNCGTPQPD